MPTKRPTSTLSAFVTIAEAVEHFEDLRILGTRLRLTSAHKSDKAVLNYFHRLCCRVSVEQESSGSRLITLNGFNTTGRETRRKGYHERDKSGRLEHEITVSELLQTREFAIGETFFVKGNGNRVGKVVRKKFGLGKVKINKQGAGYNVTRLG
jgi:hypothetical protein